MAAGKEDGARPRRSAGSVGAHPAPRRTAAARRPREETPARPGRRLSAPRAMRNAAEQLAELLGRVPESVSALKPTEDGWQADVEVLELERIPETTSVLGTYRVTLDETGELLSYERIRRYTRGQIDRRT
ncbi:gas vesicle protein [Streptomyces sp. CB03911]|uniref:gas vesicle protein GvpO n=1 Tax=Streptomyces sp. CB03911 TaxID=1804758 RepID=UPI00093DE2AF|nr:gas vesicle protein [Streptomyces sp. CB03911]OKI25629.1 gas vesicle protein [Streptomyces sp. CB03911]